MAWSVETLDGTPIATTVVVGPLPSFGDELVFEDDDRYRVLAVEHRIGSLVAGERISQAVVIVDRDDEHSIGAAMRRVRRQ
ncbi:MAG TPA: hypothetical protein VJP45_10400 [Candidatus Limnocylindria bacterium]|nr:hypothetical protein [Candidatus Limnocylindria bacterium]